MIPQPKYEIGDTVYCASTTHVKRTLPCPDCLGIKKWSVVTPGGDTLEADCGRCMRVGFGDLLSLDYWEYAGIVAKRTIGSIRIDTARRPGDYPRSGPVEYMCVETGVGSGNVYGEDQLWREERQAHAHAEQMAAAQNAKSQPKQPTPLQRHIGSLRVVDAHIDTAKAHIWRARAIANEIKAMIIVPQGDEDYISDEDLRERIDSSLSSDVRWMEEHVVTVGIPSVEMVAK